MSNFENTLPMTSTQGTDLEAVSPDLFNVIFGADPTLPEWAHAHAEGKLCPSAQLCTRNGRVIGNGVLMWWTISNEMPAAVVATDAGSVILVSAEEIAEMFYPPEYLMREPLYAHISGVAASGIDIPDTYTFLFEAAGVDFGGDDFEIIDDGDDFGDSGDTVEGPNPLIMGLMQAIMDNLGDDVEVPSSFTVGVDEAEPDTGLFAVTVIDSDGKANHQMFDSSEELNGFLSTIGLPIKV